MKYEPIKKVPIVEIDGKRCLVDTGFPGAFMSAEHGVQEFFGIPGLHFAGVQALKRYTKFDYHNSEITTSDEPISLEGGTTKDLKAKLFATVKVPVLASAIDPPVFRTYLLDGMSLLRRYVYNENDDANHGLLTRTLQDEH